MARDDLKSHHQKPVCGARKKNCKCGYRYPKGDMSETCPKCNERRYCFQPVLQAGKRCRHHGGKSLKGVDSPRYKNGLRSKYIFSTEIKDRMEEFDADETLLHLRKDIVLIETFISIFLERLDFGESSQRWNKAKKLYKSFRKYEHLNPEVADIHLKDLGETINGGVEEYRIISDIQSLMKQRVDVVKSEQDRMIRMQHLVPINEVSTLLDIIIRIIRDNVQDDSSTRKIIGQLTKLLGDDARSLD